LINSIIMRESLQPVFSWRNREIVETLVVANPR